MNAAPTSQAIASGPPGVQFRLLGRLEASLDGAELDLGPRKQRAVLALLLLNANRVVSTERLIDDLWGETPPTTARAALQVYIAGLRKALSNDGAILRTSAPGYILELEPGALDVDRFVELRADARESTDPERRAALLHEALRLWRDAPLAELRTEPFAAAAVAQLEQLRLGALEERIDADLALGRHAALVTELEALVAEHPYREPLRVQLMLALYRSGRQADALDAYQEGRRVLRDELALEPGKELRDLEAAILRQDEALLPGGLGPGAESVRRAAVSGIRGKRALFVLASVAVLATVAAAAILARRGPSAITVPPNSVGVIDAKSNRVVEFVPVGARPMSVAIGAGSAWVGNLDDGSLSRIDLATRQVVKEVPLGAAPTAIDVGAGAVWVAHGLGGQLSRVDLQSYSTKTVDVTGRTPFTRQADVDVGAGSVWAVFGDSTLARVDPTDADVTGWTVAGHGPQGIVVQNRAIWVSHASHPTMPYDEIIQQFDAKTFERGHLDSPRNAGCLRASGVAAGEGAVWVACSGEDVVLRIDLRTNSALQIPVGDGPTGVAVGAGAVWVANTVAGMVSRIDPSTRRVVARIEVGGLPTGIAVADGLVWVAAMAPPLR
jgi:YVTN family beta-propeller protein